MKVLRRLLITTLFLFIITNIVEAQTSRFVRIIRNAAGTPQTGLDVDLYAAGGGKLYDLSESGVNPGEYYHVAVVHGQYDLYVGGIARQTNIWIGAEKITTIADKFNATADEFGADNDRFTINDTLITLYNPHNILAYGAIPGDGNCDILAIQAAADAINVVGYGILLIPPGQWDYDSDNGHIQIYSNTEVRMSSGVKFNQIKGGNVLFFVNGDNDILFTGGEIDGNVAIDGNHTEHDHAFSISNASRVTVEKVYIHDMSGDGVYFADVDDGKVINCEIILQHLTDGPPDFIGRNCIAVVEGDIFKFTNNTLEGGDPAAIDLEPNANLSITDVLISINIIRGGNFGVSLSAGASNTTLDSIKINNNIFSNTGDISVHVSQATHYSILNNTILSSNLEGIRVKSSGGGIEGHYGTISNNDIYNSGLSGGSLYAGILLGNSLENIFILINRVSYSEASGIRIAGGSGSENKFITVKGNDCWNNDKNSSAGEAGISISYTDSSNITGNNCFDSQGALATQTYGFIFSQLDDCVLDLGNIGYGNLTRLYSWSNIGVTKMNQMVALTWILDNPAAGQTNFNTFKAGSAGVNQIVMPWDGHLMAASVSTNAALTGSSITFNWIKGGSGAGMNGITLSITDQFGYEEYRTQTDPNHFFQAGDVLGVIYTTTGGYLPVTNDYVVTLYFRH